MLGKWHYAPACTLACSYKVATHQAYVVTKSGAADRKHLTACVALVVIHCLTPVDLGNSLNGYTCRRCGGD